ncbi:hypothetical protein I4F81_006057 [Pyropia yezoensis]|uniref:Uncharacterized protein n=1 Tax=Pyropia yezoensis TaxID=2788 RepID=A0ACC3C137_PYRYE|nr:hypothetical protein I4F81_006057 [Neopyropia yezoensis]
MVSGPTHTHTHTQTHTYTHTNTLTHTHTMVTARHNCARPTPPIRILRAPDTSGSTLSAPTSPPQPEHLAQRRHHAPTPPRGGLSPHRLCRRGVPAVQRKHRRTGPAAARHRPHIGPVGPQVVLSPVPRRVHMVVPKDVEPRGGKGAEQLRLPRRARATDVESPPPVSQRHVGSQPAERRVGWARPDAQGARPRAAARVGWGRGPAGRHPRGAGHHPPRGARIVGAAAPRLRRRRRRRRRRIDGQRPQAGAGSRPSRPVHEGAYPVASGHCVFRRQSAGNRHHQRGVDETRRAGAVFSHPRA